MNPAQLPELRDIHLPPPPPAWPPAPGWWLLAAFVAILLLASGWYLQRRLRQRRRRRLILAELDRLRRQFRPEAATEFVAGVSSLLRRVALARYPRTRVAPLAGDDWLRFLDVTGGNGAFAQGPGWILGSGPYSPRVEVNADALLELARRWVLKNTGT